MTSSEEFAAFVGIDWADEEHAVSLTVNGRDYEASRVPQRAEKLEAWAAQLRVRFAGRPVAVCLEQSRGALAYALQKYDFLVLFPINPKQLARYREALAPSHAKDDPTDAQLACRFVEQHHRQLRPWRPDGETTRALRLLTEDRRRWVDRRTAASNQLGQKLKECFPLALDLVGHTLLDDWFLRLLVKYPSQRELCRAAPRSIARRLPKRRHTDGDETDPRLATIRSAVPLVSDQALIEAGRLAVRELAEMLLALNQTVARYEDEIARWMARHPDAVLFGSFPGAGPAMAPRLAAAFGVDRDRYASAQEVQQISGTAPVTKQSGKSRTVQRRRACPKFLHQTFHEYADHSRKKSAWARAYYHMLRARGVRHHAALRSLAFKWIRILFRCWKERQPYDEPRYLEHLRQKNASLLAWLPTPNPLKTV
jgi:transposase